MYSFALLRLELRVRIALIAAAMVHYDCGEIRRHLSSQSVALYLESIYLFDLSLSNIAHPTMANTTSTILTDYRPVPLPMVKLAMQLRMRASNNCTIAHEFAVIFHI